MRAALAILTILFLLLAGAASVLLLSGNVHERIRTALVTEVRRALNREVSVGAVRGDPFRGVVLDDVAVAKVSRLAGGMLFSARNVTVEVDPLRLGADLLAGRGPLPSIRRMVISHPQLFLERNPRGRWNILDLFASDGGGPPSASTFTPLVVVEGGVLNLVDWVGQKQRPFTARFELVNGQVDLRRMPVVAIDTGMVNIQGARRSPVSVRGRYAAGEGTVDLDVNTEGAPVHQWGPYLIRLPRLAFEGGTFDGVFHLLTSRWGNRLVLDYRGTLRLHDAAGRIDPQGARIRGARGLLEVDNLHLRTGAGDLHFALEGSPVRMRGEIATVLGGRADLAISSPGMDLGTLRRLFFARTGLRLAGRAGGDLRLVGPLSDPTIAGTIVQASGTFNGQPFTNASSDLALYGDFLAFTDFTLRTGGGALAGDFRLSLAEPGLLLAAAGANLAPETIRQAVALNVPVQGRLAGGIALARTGRRLLAEGAVQVAEPGSVRGLVFDHLRAGFWYDDGDLAFPYLVADRGQTSVHASGTVSRDGRLAMDLAASDLDLRLVAAEARLPVALAGAMDAEGELTGTLADPQFLGTVAVGPGRAGRLAFDGALGEIRLTRLEAATPGLVLHDGRGTYTVSGSARWARPAGLDVTVRARDISAERLARIARVPAQVSGTVSGAVAIRGPLSAPSARGTLALEGGRVEGQRVDRADVAFRLEGDLFHIDSARARLGASLVEAEGAVDPEGLLRLEFTATGFRLRDLTVVPRSLFILEGAVDLRGVLSGTVRAPRVAATLHARDLLVNGQPFTAASGEIRWQQGRLELAPVTLRDAAGTYALRGTVVPGDPLRFDLRGDVTGGRLSTLLRLARVRPPFPLDGRLDGTVAARGTPGNVAATLDARLTGGRLADHSMPQARLNLSYADQVITVRELRAQVGEGPQEGVVAAQGRLALRGDSALEVGGTNLPLDLLGPLVGLDRRLAGTMAFTTQLNGPLANPEVGISLEVQNGGINGLTFDSLVANAFYKDGQFNVEQALLTEDGHRVKGEGTIPFNPALRTLGGDRPMRFEISLVEANLSLLALLTPQVEEATGRLEGRVTLSGTPSRPEMTGGVNVRDGRVKLRSLVTPLEEIQADVAFDEDRVTISTLRARMGQGAASLSGSVAISNFRADAVDLRLQARDARMEIKPVFSGVVNADIRFTGPLRDPARSPELSGDVSLKEGTLAIAARPGGTSAPRAWPNIRFRDVRVVAGPALAAHLGRLRIDLQEGSALVVAGTLREPQLDGTWRAERGAVTLLGQTFLIQEGEARFLPQLGIMPLLTLRAETQVGTTRIFIEVNGATPEELPDRLVFSSDPPMSRQEIIALLGRQAGFAQLVGGQLESALRVELGRVFFGQVGQTIARALGLAEFTIQYDLEHPLQLRIGKLLIRELFVTLTTIFEERTRFIWALEWRFTPQMMMTLNVDNFGRFDILGLYRIQF